MYGQNGLDRMSLSQRKDLYSLPSIQASDNYDYRHLDFGRFSG